MPVATFEDGRRYPGATALDVINAMKNDGILTFAKDVPEYMEFVARQAMRLEGQTVRLDSPEVFLADLAAFGYLTLEPLQ